MSEKAGHAEWAFWCHWYYWYQRYTVLGQACSGTKVHVLPAFSARCTTHTLFLCYIPTQSLKGGVPGKVISLWSPLAGHMPINTISFLSFDDLYLCFDR